MLCVSAHTRPLLPRHTQIVSDGVQQDVEIAELSAWFAAETADGAAPAPGAGDAIDDAKRAAEAARTAAATARKAAAKLKGDA